MFCLFILLCYSFSPTHIDSLSITVDSSIYDDNYFSLCGVLKYNDEYFINIEHRGVLKYGSSTRIVHCPNVMVRINQKTKKEVGRYELVLNNPSDLFLLNDTIFVTGDICYTDNDTNSYYFDESDNCWQSINDVSDIVYEDSQWRVLYSEFGEFGDYVWFLNKNTTQQYLYNMTIKRLVKKRRKAFLAINHYGIYLIKSPENGMVCTSATTYESAQRDFKGFINSLELVRTTTNYFCDTLYRSSTLNPLFGEHLPYSRQEGLYINGDYFHFNHYLKDTILITSYISNNNNIMTASCGGMPCLIKLRGDKIRILNRIAPPMLYLENSNQYRGNMNNNALASFISKEGVYYVMDIENKKVLRISIK